MGVRDLTLKIKADSAGLSPKWGNDVEIQGAITIESIMEAIKTSGRDTFYVPRNVYDWLCDNMDSDCKIKITSLYISNVRVLPMEAPRAPED